jgi:nucleoid DNA-binding protein
MTKGELITELAKRCAMTKKAVSKVVNGFIELVYECARKGEPIRIPRFGVFKVRERKGRITRNPKTGEKIEVPATKVLRFYPSSELKDF